MENSDLIKINNISLEDLKNDQVILDIQELADDDQYLTEPMAAREFYDAIDSLFVKYGPQINGTDTYQKLFNIKTKMFWQGIVAMDKKLRQDSLQENLVYALKNNIDVVGNISTYLNLFEFGTGPDNEERQIFISSLTRNEEAIGAQPIKFKSGEGVRNTVTNWVKDYLSYSTPNKPLNDETYEMTQYMYSSPNAKALGPEDKQILTSVLNIYNFLRHPKYIPEIVKEDETAVPKPPVSQRPQIPAAPRPTPQPVSVAPSAPPKEMSAFEKKLAQISSPAPSGGHGVDLAILKQRIEQAPTKTQSVPVASKAQVMTPQEIRREVATRELPAHLEAKLPVASAPAVKAPPRPVAPPKVVAPPKPAAPVVPKPVVQPKPIITTGISLSDIKTAEDLKKLGLDHLRRGSIEQQIAEIKAKIIQLAKTNKILPYYLLAAFEESSLFKAYLAHGNAMFEGRGQTSELTKQEFEGIADLRKEIQHL